MIETKTAIAVEPLTPRQQVCLGNRCIICGSQINEFDTMICRDCKEAIIFVKKLRQKELEKDSEQFNSK